MIEHYNKNYISNAFSKAASTYDQYANLQQQAAEYLLSLSRAFAINSNTLLDLGCGTGYVTQQLLEYFPATIVTGLDISKSMLDFAKNNYHHPRINWLGGDAEKLPIQSNVVDAIFSNLMMQWIRDLPSLFTEFYRVLQHSGYLILSTFGPQTLKELNAAWHSQNHRAVHHFFSKNEIFSKLNHNFKILHIEETTIVRHYHTVMELMLELRNLGATNALATRPKGLIAKEKFYGMQNHYEHLRTTEAVLPASFEIFYFICQRK